MNITKQFYRYVSQNILGMMGVSIYILADTFFISVAGGADGITVLNLCLPIYSLLFAFGAMIGVGAATRFSILRARKDPDAEYYFTNAVLWACIFSAPFILAGIFFPDTVLRVMGGDAEITAMGVGYARIFLIFTPGFMLNYVCGAFTRNDGAPTVAMAATLCGSLFNVVFDYVFMFVFGWGMSGAAAATAASPVLGILICQIHFRSKKNTVHLKRMMPSLRRLISSAELGISSFIGEFASGVTTTVFNFLLLSLVGNIAVAAYGVIANLAVVMMAIFNGISQGAQPLLSDAYGRGEKKTVGSLLKLGSITSFLISAVLFAAAYIFTDDVVAVFNSEGSAQLAEIAHIGLRIYFAGYLFAGVNTFLSGYFGAVDMVFPAFFCSMLRGVLAISVLAVLFARLYGITGVWMSYAAAEGLTLVISIIMLKQGKAKVV